MSETPIQHEILRRIHRKQVDTWHKVRSITLGIDMYNILRDEIDCLTFASYVYTGKFESSYNGNGELYGYPIRICYKRKNLIQINLDKPRRKKYIVDMEEPYPRIYCVSFLTSAQQPAKLSP